MSKEDLVPIKDHERAVELGRKGGLAKSKAKQIANIKKSLRHGEHSKYCSKDIVEFVKNAELSCFEMYDLYKSIKDSGQLREGEKIKLLNALVGIHKSVHGDVKIVRGSLSDEFEDFKQKWREFKEKNANKTN